MPSTTLIVLSSSLLLAGCTGTRPPHIGVRDGKLAPCPASPNCVSSQGADRDHVIAPLQYSGSAREAMDRLKDIVTGMKRARIITQTPAYLHAEFTSAVFRFVDDVEFLLDENSGTIPVRSASRSGHSDLGVNRGRVDAIRKTGSSAAAAAAPPPR